MFLILVLLAVSGLMATDLFVPSLPSLALTFQQPMNHVQLTISLFLFGFAVSQLVYGPISDRVGRRMPVLVGVSLFLLGGLLCVFAPSFTWLCIGRILQGIGAGGGLSLTRVILRDLYSHTTLAIKSSQLGIFVCLAPAVAPCLGGILQAGFGYRGPFVFMVVYALVLLILLLTSFKESLQHKDTTLNLSNTLKHYGELLRNSLFMRYVTVAGLAFGAVILYANIIPFIVQNQLGLSAFQNGIILLGGALGLSLSAFIGSRVVERFGAHRLCIMGLLLLLISGAIFAGTGSLFQPHIFIIIPALFFTTLACGLLFPNALALAFSQVQVKIGIAGAVYGSTQIFITVILNFILNGMAHQTLLLLGGFYLIMACGGLILLYPCHSCEKPG
jgi:predicted MFS family arabinose efflux permease